jgi:hypothetical protein
LDFCHLYYRINWYFNGIFSRPNEHESWCSICILCLYIRFR